MQQASLNTKMKLGILHTTHHNECYIEAAQKNVATSLPETVCLSALFHCKICTKAFLQHKTSQCLSMHSKVWQKGRKNSFVRGVLYLIAWCHTQSLSPTCWPQARAVIYTSNPVLTACVHSAAFCKYLQLHSFVFFCLLYCTLLCQ